MRTKEEQDAINKACKYHPKTNPKTKVQKELKVTTAKLAKWLKVNGIKRKVHRRGN